MKKIKEIFVGDIVKSTQGHDQGKFSLVVKRVGDDYVMMVDGERRKVDSPKLKKIKHIVLAVRDEKTAKLVEDGNLTNQAVKDILNQYIMQQR